MKHTLSVALCLLLAALLLVALPTEAEADIYRDTLRLHVLAASDSEEDQRIKLSVRDFVLTHYGEALREADTVSEAIEKTSSLLGAIETDVNAYLTALGVNYRAHVTLSEEWYTTRVYESVTLPRGTYASLRITLDAGEGANWWCVMYPPMCLSLATGQTGETDGYTAEEQRLIDGEGRTVKFKLLEVLSDLFG